VVQKSEDRPTSTESRLGDGTATRAGQSGMAVTRENDNVDDKLIEKKRRKKQCRRCFFRQCFVSIYHEF